MFKSRLPNWRQFFLIVCTLVFLGSIYIHKIEPNWLQVKQVNLTLPHLSPEFKGYRIVQITDIHAGDWLQQSQLERIVEMVNRQQPDLVVLTGDYVTRSPKDGADILKSTLSKLHPRDRSLAVLGNHDYYAGGKAIAAILETAGIQVLENDVYSLKRGEATLHIAGVGSLMADKIDLDRVLAKLKDGEAIMLAHEPDFVGTTATTGRFALQLSGHSHGGQVKIPFLRRKVLPPYAKTYPSGLYRVGNMFQYTSRGVGMVKPHVRFNCRPEITVLNLG
jgi:uncharacterized protein